MTAQASASAPLRVPLELRVRLLELARAALPAEACGLILGDEGGLVALHPARNLAARPAEAFELDPGAVVAAERQARVQELAVVGVWHSHPRGEAEPSAADRSAAWSGWEHLIVAPAAERGVLRAWRTSEGRLVERELAP